MKLIRLGDTIINLAFVKQITILAALPGVDGLVSRPPRGESVIIDFAGGDSFRHEMSQEDATTLLASLMSDHQIR